MRKAGNQVRITAQLIDARSDTHLWSETYDRPLDDIFAVQDEIAAAVVAQLKIKLLGAHRRRRSAIRRPMRCSCRPASSRASARPRDIEQSIALYQQALAIDPDDAAAWDGLAAQLHQPGRQRPAPASRRASGWRARPWTRRWRSTRTTHRPTPRSAGSR